MQYGGYDGADDAAQSRTAFREAEKKYKLFRERKMKMKRGKRKPGKLVTRPIDMSDVLDLHLRPGDPLPSEVVCHKVFGYEAPVYTFARHPGLVYMPGAVPPEQQLELTMASLTDYPEPPARTNHVLQYGPFSGLWRAAQQGLRLNWGRMDDQHAGAPRRESCEDTSAMPHSYPGSSSNFVANDTTTSISDGPAAAEECEELGTQTGVAVIGLGRASTPVADVNCSNKSGPFGDAVGCMAYDLGAGCPEQPSGQPFIIHGAAVPNSPSGSCRRAEHCGCSNGGKDLRKGCESAGVAAASIATINSCEAGRRIVAADDADDDGCSMSSGVSSDGSGSGGRRSRRSSGSGSDCCDGAVKGAPSFEECWSTGGVGPPAVKLLRKLRWATLGPQFKWTERQYDFTSLHRPLPPSLGALAKQLAAVVDQLQAAGLQVMPVAASSGGYKPDAAIVNYYQQGDVLGGHLDDVERDMAQPIVSVSLGCPAIFLMGGATKEVTPSALLLRGGDVLVLAGEARCCYHGVPRILEPEQCGDFKAEKHTSRTAGPVDTYIRSARINISIRAVA